MVLKFFLAALLSTALFYRCTGNSVEPRLDAWDEVATLIEELKTNVERAVATSWQTIYRIDGDTYSQGYLTNLAAHEAVVNNTEIIRRQLQDLRQLAEVLDRIYCLYNVEKTLDFAASDLIIDISGCVEHIRQEAMNLVSDTAAHLDFAHARIVELEANFEQCPRESATTQCIVTLRGQVQLALDSLSAGIIDLTIEIMLNSRSWLEGIETCAADRVGLIFAEGTRLLGQVNSCLINPETSKV